MIGAQRLIPLRDALKQIYYRHSEKVDPDILELMEDTLE